MEYVITLRNETDEDVPVKAVTGGNDEGVGGEVSDESKGQAYAVKMVKRLVSVGAIVHTADQIVSHQLSMISLETGAREYGQRVSYIYQKAGGFVKSVAAGAVSGSVAGWQGALIGAAVATVTSVAGNLMNYFFKQDELSAQKSLEDTSIRMRTMRATVSGRRYSNVTEY